MAVNVTPSPSGSAPLAIGGVSVPPYLANAANAGCPRIGAASSFPSGVAPPPTVRSPSSPSATAVSGELPLVVSITSCSLTPTRESMSSRESLAEARNEAMRRREPRPSSAKRPMRKIRSAGNATGRRTMSATETGGEKGYELGRRRLGTRQGLDLAGAEGSGVAEAGRSIVLYDSIRWTPGLVVLNSSHEISRVSMGRCESAANGLTYTSSPPSLMSITYFDSILVSSPRASAILVALALANANGSCDSIAPVGYGTVRSFTLQTYPHSVTNKHR